VHNHLQLQCSAHLNPGDYDQAIAACEKALALDDSWLKYLFLLGAYAEKGDMAKAQVPKAELLKRNPMSRSLISRTGRRSGLTPSTSSSERRTCTLVCARPGFRNSRGLKQLDLTARRVGEHPVPDNPMSAKSRKRAFADVSYRQKGDNSLVPQHVPTSSQP